MAITNPTPVTQLPMPVPSTQDPVNFDLRADAFLGALPLWGDQLNALGLATYANAQASYEYSQITLAARDLALQYRDAAAASASAALSSQNAAKASEIAAKTSETNAGSYAGAALASQNDAANSAFLAKASQVAAKDSETLALQYRNEAEFIARGGFVSSSTTTVSISIGPKTITVEAQKAFVPGQYAIVSNRGAYNNRFGGYIISYNPTNGQMTIQVDMISGGGQYADWIVGISVSAANGGNLTITEVVSADTVISSGIFYVIRKAATLFIPNGWESIPGFTFGWSCDLYGQNVTGQGDFGRINWGSAKVKGASGGIMYMYDFRDTAKVIYTGNQDVGFVEI